MAIHPTAIINPKAEIDTTVEVGPFCVIDANVRVHAGCKLFQGVYLTGWTEIAKNCVIHPGAIVGHEPQDTKYTGERTYCRIGEGTVIREYATIHRGTEPESATTIGDHCFLLAGSHVGHNCKVGQHTTLVNGAVLGGHVEIGDHVMMGGLSGVHQFVRIGAMAIVAGFGRVTQDVVPFAMVGVDGRIAGLNRIGMRRANIEREDQRAVREAYRVLFESGLSMQEASETLSKMDRKPTTDRILEFVLAESKRGIAGKSKSSKGQPLDGEPD